MNVESPQPTDLERGATLIELLMGIVLTGIVLAAVTGGILVYMGSADRNRNLLNETPELQLTATRFGSDVQSANTIQKPAAGTAPTCGTLPSGSGSTTLVNFGWTDPGTVPATSDDQAVVVSYTYDPVAHQLVRARCRAGSVVEKTTLVNHVQPAQKPDVTCDVSSCDSTTKRVDLSLRACTADSAGTACVDSYIPASFTGVRRMV